MMKPLIVLLIFNFQIKAFAQKSIDTQIASNTEILKNEDVQECLNAINDLENIDNPRTIPPLILALKHKDFKVRRQAMNTLGEKADSRAIEPLLEILRNSKNEDSHFAASTLRELGSHGGHLKAIEGMLTLLSTDDIQLRRIIVNYLGWKQKFPMPQLITSMIELLKDSDTEIRLIAVRNLGDLQDIRAVEPLIDLFNTDSTVQKAVLSSLGEFSNQRVREFFISLLKDKDVAIRRFVSGLEGLADQSNMTEILIQTLKDNDPKVRINIIRSLRWKEEKKVIEALIETLKDTSKEVKLAAIKELGNPLNQPLRIQFVVNPLIDILEKETDKVIQTLILQALLNYGNSSLKAIETIVKYLPNWSIVPNSRPAINFPTNIFQVKSIQEKVYIKIFYKDRIWLNTNWVSVKQILSSDIESEEWNKVEFAVRSFIAIGKSEIIPELRHALYKTRNQSLELILIYLNCENNELREMAKIWAKSNGYNVTSGGYGSSSTWGGLR